MTPPLWFPAAFCAGPGTAGTAGWFARSMTTFPSKVSVEPFQTKRSTRLPSSGTFAFTFVSSPVELSVQYRYT